MSPISQDDEYDAWFRACFPRAVAVARRVAGSGGAEDAALEAFAAAYARWGRVSKLHWRDGWVLRTTFRQALAQARRLHELPNVRPGEQIARSMEDEILVRRLMVEALRRLPRRQREAVALRYLVDMPEREVADALGVSPGAVKVHIHRGIAALRSSLGPDYLKEEPDASTP
ncbi:MAG TPA: sigma-70 family RNA polymerase sigma factor [Actinomycetota bacterium]|nr:sigma-70 family RNA polymerase sigma factor [Actinomycetota bacterium]